MAVKTHKKHLEQLQKDLQSTIQELSDLYEEITILYHFPLTITELTIDEICNVIIEEIQKLLDVKTSAILLLDEERNELYTAVSSGNWLPEQVFKKGDNIIWDAIEKNKSLVFCDIESSPYKNNFAVPEIKAILVCPLIGKKQAIGAIVIGEKPSGEEFYSSDTKFLMAIASQAAFAIENASLHNELENFFFSTVMAFVKAIESRSQWTAGHSERVTKYALAIAKEMGMDRYFLERLKICGLLHDIGKIATPMEIIDKHGTLTEEELIEVEQHPLTGSVILGDLKPFRDIIGGIKYHHEKWDGSGVPEKLKGETIPIMARIVAVTDAFDAMTSDRPYRERMSIMEAIKRISDNAGKQFDPQIVNALLRIKDTM